MITSTTAKSTYVVASGVTEYAIGFVYNTNPDGSPQIKVYKNKLSNTPLIYGVDYTLSANGLNIVVDSAVEPGDRLDIIRNIPLVQLSDYVIGRIDPEQIEKDFDACVMRDQLIEADIQFVGEIPLDHETRLQECEGDIDDLESLVPAQATDENQLADKEFVNSSIATSTATFRGTYSSLADLQAVTADDNDYGFVVSTDAAGNTVYSRYKYSQGSWVFEYNLNNSSFTAEQWAAINSGITAGLVDNFNATGHNVGDIFWTMRTDNELNGAILCDGSLYNTTDFTGGESIGTLLEAGKIPYVSISTWMSLLAQNQAVGYIGWDGTGTTAFRVPYLHDVFIEAGDDVNAPGFFVQPGIPNIKGNVTCPGSGWYSGASHSGCFTAPTDGGKENCSSTGSNNAAKINFDASAYSTMYRDDVNTVQPRAIKYRPMIQLMIAATDEAVATCTSVLADVAGLKSHEVIAFQAPTLANNYTWYRKYADGWVEQGGTKTSGGSGNHTIDLPVTMSDTAFWAQVTRSSGASTTSVVNVWVRTPTLTNQITVYTSDDTGIKWEVKGMMAESELPSYNSGGSSGGGGAGSEDE